MDIKEFLEKSFTAYHAVENCEKMLDLAGFKAVDLSEKWNPETGKGYYTVINGTTLIAFKAGGRHAFNVVESHTDSPSLKVKGDKLVDSPEGRRVNVEKYGGSLLYSFLDVPLKIAGRIAYADKDHIRTKLVVSDYNVNVPSLAPHHNPDANTKLQPSVQKDMLPLIGRAPDGLYKTLTSENVIDADLFAVPAVKPFLSGAEEEFLCAPRIDNLTSVYSSIKAIIRSQPESIAVACCFDNEEIGSLTMQGADSNILTTVLRKINRSFGKNDDDFESAVENGFLLSADNAHAVHPAFPEKSDVAEKVYLNGGIVIKHHPNYSTDGLSSAVVKALFDKSGTRYQDYYNNSDVRCGSTIGLVTSARLNMHAADIGIAQLAMHSGIETAGLADVAEMERGLTSFLNTSFEKTKDGVKIR